jgi:hypothetical protein
MSNRRKTRWSSAEVTAANAEALLGELWWHAEAASARKVMTDRVLNDLAAAGYGPELIIEGGEALMGLDDGYWHGIYQQITAD